MSDNTVQVKVTGDATGAQVAMRQAAAAVQDNVAKIREHMDGIGSVFEKFNVAMLSITAVLAGGKVFKEAVDETVKLTKEAQALGKQFGITATQGSVLMVALDDMHISTEAATTANNRITQTLRTNEEAITSLGVATRDQNGNYRNSLDIMMDVNQHLSMIKEGTDRNVEGQKIYGRAWTEVSATLRLTAEAMESAQAKADDLGLTVGERSVAQTKAYRDSMNDVNDVMTGIKKAIGDALLPVLTEMGNWFASIGPEAVNATKDAMLALNVVIQAVAVTFQTAWNIIAGIVEELTVAFLSVADALSHALNGDFSGAVNALKTGGDQMVDIAKERAGKIADAFTNAQAKVANAMSGALDKDKATGGKGGAGAASGDDGSGGKARTGEWETRLSEMKAAYQQQQSEAGSFREFDKQQEVEYWQNILATTKVSTEEKRAIRQKIATAEIAISKESFDGEVANLKAQEAAFKNNMDEKLAIAQQVAAKMAAAYGEDSKQYADAQKDVIAIERQKAEQLKAIEQQIAESKKAAALADVDSQEEDAKLKVQLGQTTQQELLQQEMNFENERFAIKSKALQDALTLADEDPDKNPAKKAEIDAEIEALEEQHQLVMQKLGGDRAAAEMSTHDQVQSRMQGSFQQTLTKFAQGNATVMQTLRAMLKNVADAIIQTLTGIAAKKMALFVTDQLMGKKQMAMDAAQAATGAAKSASSIPIVGWALALGAAAAVFAGLKSYSAAGGYDIPAGVNPMTQLHAREMVLPAHLADKVRNATDGGGGDTHHHTWNVTAWDGQSVKDMLMEHGPTLATSLTRQFRNGFPLPTR